MADTQQAILCKGALSMKRRFDAETLDAIFAAPLELVANLRAPGGGVHAFPKRKDIEDFLNDPEGWFARSQGVTREDYHNWIDSDGLPRCGATLKDGHRCKNPVSGGIQRGLLDWLQADAGFCYLHGGDGSEVAKTKRFGRKP